MQDLGHSSGDDPLGLRAAAALHCVRLTRTCLSVAEQADLQIVPAQFSARLSHDDCIPWQAPAGFDDAWASIMHTVKQRVIWSSISAMQMCLFIRDEKP